MILVHITSDCGEGQRICLVPEHALNDKDIELLSRGFINDKTLFELVKKYTVQPHVFADPIPISRAFFVF